jgi:hypothetical protein
MTGSYTPQFANRWDFDTMESSDEDDFMAEIEADELADGDEDHEEALDAWREAQDADGGDELPCGLTRAQLRTASKTLFVGLAEVISDILSRSKNRASKHGGVHGCLVSGGQLAGVAVALGLPGFEKGAEVARRIHTTRAGVSFWAAEYGRRLGVTSEASSRKQREGVLAMARKQAGLRARVGPVVHKAIGDSRESKETQSWLASLPPEEAREARKALGMKKAGRV